MVELLCDLKIVIYNLLPAPSSITFPFFEFESKTKDTVA